MDEGRAVVVAIIAINLTFIALVGLALAWHEKRRQARLDARAAPYGDAPHPSKHFAGVDP